METKEQVSISAMDSPSINEQPHRTAKGCLKILGLTCVTLVVLLLAGLSAVKVWWDWRFFDGYNARLPLQSEVVQHSEVNGHIREKLTFQGKAGERVTAVFHFPKDAAEKVPCLVLLYGIGQEMDFVDEIADPYVQAGYAILCIEQYGQGERKLKKKSGLDGLIHLTERLPRMVIEARRVVDYLETRPEIDQDQLTLFGISLGAIMGSSALAMEPRFKSGILMWGGGDLPRLLTENEFVRNGEVPRSHRIALRLLGSALFGTAEPLKRIAAISPRPLLFQNALQDEIIPRACTDAYYEKAGDPKEILWYECGHEKGLSMELIHHIIADQIAWLKKNGKKSF